MDKLVNNWFLFKHISKFEFISHHAVSSIQFKYKVLLGQNTRLI